MTFDTYVLWRPRISRDVRSARYAKPPYIQYSQKTPMPSQKGAKSGLIIQNAPWMDQKMKKTTKRWCVYQNRSNCARRCFSAAVQTMAESAISMTYPDHPGPVARFAKRKPTNPSFLSCAKIHKFLQWAIVCTQESQKIAHPTSLWKVMFLSNGIMPFKGVRRTIDIRFLQTGNRTRATSTWRVNAAERASIKVKPYSARIPMELS
jgi:hypothetical protein